MYCIQRPLFAPKPTQHWCQSIVVSAPRPRISSEPWMQGLRGNARGRMGAHIHSRDFRSFCGLLRSRKGCGGGAHPRGAAGRTRRNGRLKSAAMGWRVAGTQVPPSPTPDPHSLRRARRSHAAARTVPPPVWVAGSSAGQASMGSSRHRGAHPPVMSRGGGCGGATGGCSCPSSDTLFKKKKNAAHPLALGTPPPTRCLPQWRDGDGGGVRWRWREGGGGR